LITESVEFICALFDVLPGSGDALDVCYAGVFVEGFNEIGFDFSDADIVGPADEMKEL